MLNASHLGRVYSVQFRLLHASDQKLSLVWLPSLPCRVSAMPCVHGQDARIDIRCQASKAVISDKHPQRPQYAGDTRQQGLSPDFCGATPDASAAASEAMVASMKLLMSRNGHGDKTSSTSEINLQAS